MSENDMNEEMNPEAQGETTDSTPASQADTPAVPETSSAGHTAKLAAQIKDEVQKVIIGMDSVMDECIVAMMVDGHVLFEGYPGLAKTLLVKLIARSIDTRFSRIQFTPDLMPSDVIGTQLLDMEKQEFRFHPGPIFANLVLIDEINRAPAKTQSALFEAMEERQVSVEGKTYLMDEPFLVIGTQNPIDQEGTYRLPEAQLDRFLFKIRVPYPERDEELKILERFDGHQLKSLQESVKHVANKELLDRCKEEIRSVFVDEQIKAYITDVVRASREHPHVYMGASPRASLALLRASKAFAAMASRNYVSPDDVQRCCRPVLDHRLILNASAEMEGYTSADVIESLLNEVEVPR